MFQRYDSVYTASGGSLSFRIHSGQQGLYWRAAKPDLDVELVTAPPTTQPA